MNNSKYNFWISVNNRPVDEYNHEDSVYIEGRKGSEYTINFTNRFYKPLKIVFSVDGLNIITGNTTFERGYVVEPQETISIPGWLSSPNTAQRFVFSSKNDSYNINNKSGDADNIGVIGAMVFDIDNSTFYADQWYKNTKKRLTDVYGYADMWDDKWNNPWVEPTIASGIGSTGTVLCAASSAINRRVDVTASAIDSSAVKQELGTEYGEDVDFKTTTSYKKFLSTPSHILTIYYDSKKGLEKRGIVLKVAFTKPNPFPGFCPSPIKRT